MAGVVVTFRVELARAQSFVRVSAVPGLNALDVRSRDARHGIGVWNNVVIAVWRTETRASAVEKLSEALAGLSRAHREVALLQVVEDGATAPDAESRRAITSMLQQHGGSIRCSAVVYEGDGFRAATLRAVVTGITLLGRPAYPHLVFASTISAINWTALHFSHDGSGWAEQLRNAVTELREAIQRPLPTLPGGLVGAPRFGALR